jgi:hypothetical protein
MLQSGVRRTTFGARYGNSFALGMFGVDRKVSGASCGNQPAFRQDI